MTEGSNQEERTAGAIGAIGVTGIPEGVEVEIPDFFYELLLVTYPLVDIDKIMKRRSRKVSKEEGHDSI